jgi:hypothetical protein
MKRADFLNILFLIVIALAIYYPLFYSEYLYTDEAVQLWLYKKGSGFQMFQSQGRYITEKLFQWLFNRVGTVHDIIYIRLFSLCGWLLVVPAWYYIIRKVVIKEGLPQLLTGFAILYLVCTPSFSISVSWASCLELFIANTAGLISGYILYASIKYENSNVNVPFWTIIASTVFGVISLFTYQNGFGCFLIPFLLHLLANPKKLRLFFIGAGVYLFIYIVYYLLFRYSIRVNHLEASNRTSLHINVWDKLKFFFTRPLSSSFHFTYLFNEKSIAGVIAYLLVFTIAVGAYWLRFQTLKSVKRIEQLILVISLLMIIYLPSLVVKENYSSNRTLLALNMAVFLFVVITLLHFIKKVRIKQLVVFIASALFVFNAWYNFNKQFLAPVTNEYKQIRTFIEEKYQPGIDTFYFIRPMENFFAKKYYVTRSWDEFGVPSTFFEWTPEFFIRQVIFEKTGNRQLAEKLMTRNWLGTDLYLKSGEQASVNILLINTEEILTGR